MSSIRANERRSGAQCRNSVRLAIGDMVLDQTCRSGQGADNNYYCCEGRMRLPERGVRSNGTAVTVRVEPSNQAVPG
jgi:hypothetical protein